MNVNNCQFLEAAGEMEPALRQTPSKLYVETTTHCNLRCPMCVKQARDSRVIDNDMTPEIYSALVPAFPYLESLVLNGIGEPLMHPHLLDFVRQAREAMPDEAWIGFQSNGLLLDGPTADALVSAGLDRICLSVDGVRPETFSKVREGEELSDMDRAFRVLGEARWRHAGARLRIGAEFVAMRENFRQLPDTLRWVAARGAGLLIVTHALPYDAAQTGQALFHNATDAAVELFETWEKTMAEQGLDIRLYDYMVWEKERIAPDTIDPRIRKVNNLVTKMRAEARQKDIFMDVLRLLKRDAVLAAEIQEVFEETRELAEGMGIELRLPAVVPRVERKCDFITGGSAFVSWDGDVHPCYFLWHQYRCHINDWDKLVKPKAFGNVLRKPLLDIWNDEAFHGFRANVLNFDYPFCSNCGVAPCDLVQAEDFAQDCFASEEPCGACPWGLGLLQCLQ